MLESVGYIKKFNGEHMFLRQSIRSFIESYAGNFVKTTSFAAPVLLTFYSLEQTTRLVI